MTVSFGKNEKDLLGNHLEFLRTQRGNVTFKDDQILVESSRPAFTFLILSQSKPASALLKQFNTLYVTPWAGLSEAEIQEYGYKEKGGITYMTLAAPIAEWRVVKDLTVTTAKNSKEIDVFGEVQSRGFLEKKEDYDLWSPFLCESNRRNLKNPHQLFYVGFNGQQAVGVVLTVSTPGLTGIYAVATPPEHRKKGVSTTIMHKAIVDAQGQGDTAVTLQVAQGSYAEAFYTKLGFQKEFRIRIFSR